MSLEASLAQIGLATRTLMVNPHVRVTICGNNEVLVKHGSRSRFSRVIRDDGHTKLLGRVMRALRIPNSLTQLVEQGLVRETETEDAAKLVEYLFAEKILISPQEYLPHVYLAMQFGGEGVEVLRSRTVGVLGSGFLGSRIARELGRMRPKELILLDARRTRAHDPAYFDLPSSLVRPEAPFVAVTAAALAAEGYGAVRGREASLEDAGALAQVFEESDFVVAALEWPSPAILHLANEVALTVGKPWMSTYVDGSEGLVGPLYVPGETVCFNEFEIQNEAAVTLQDDYLLHKETLLQEAQADHLVPPPFLGILAGWTTVAALSFLTSERTFVAGRCLRIDFERLSVDYQDVLRLPRCPACAGQRPAYRHTFL